MGSYNAYEDQQLFQQIAAGNERAFREVFDKYNLLLYSFITRYVYSSTDAEEIVQDAFLLLWKNRHQLSDVKHPRNYIFTVTRNNAYHYLLKLSRNQKAIKALWQSTVTEGNPVLEGIEARESEQTIYQSITQLSPLKQQIFLMSRRDGMTHQEISKRTGLSKSRVKNIIVEVLKVAKARLTLGSVFILALLSLFFYSSR